MSSLKKIKRNKEKVRLRVGIDKAIKDLGISKKFFKKTIPNLSGSGYEYSKTKRRIGGRGVGSHKPSLKQQFSFLQDLVEFQDDFKEKNQEQKKAIMKDQLEKSGEKAAEIIEQEDEISENELLGNIRSVFDRK